MSDISVVLDLGNSRIAVKTSNFSSLEYNNYGSVYRFEKNSKTYVYCVKGSLFYGFLEKENFEKQTSRFHNKEKVTEKEWRINEFASFSLLLKASSGDVLEGAYPIFSQSGMCKQLYHYPYVNSIPDSFSDEIYKVTTAPPFDCDDFGGTATPAGKFFDNYKNEIFWDTNQNDINLVGEIASLLKEAGQKSASAFIDFTLSNTLTTDFAFYNNDGNGYTREQFLEYKKGLIRWLAVLKDYSSEIGKLLYEEKLFLAVNYMYRHNMLTALLVPDRIRILKVLVEKNSLTWKWVNADYGFIQTEDLALYVLKSINNVPDATDFLNLLVSTHVIKAQYNYTTLYKLLFLRMDDYGGADNFTAYVKELERIVLLKNGIPTTPTPQYTISQLQNLTEAQFIWREKGPKKGRVKYRITDITDTKIKFEETIIVKTEEREVYTASTEGVPVFAGYEEIAVDTVKQNIELNHFDLVSIHFYQDPSFIDLSTDQTYVGKNYLTFAGFVDYILEKEETKIAEDVFNAALFAISLLFGFGELVAAIRTVNIAKAVLGLAMVTSDSALYLQQSTPFRNYIITTYGTQKGNEILDDMGILSTIASLGTNGVAGSGILKAFSREEGLKLVGTGEAILKDSNALAHLSANEIDALKEAIKKFKNELYSLRNNEEAASTIINTRASVFFNKFANLESGLNALSQADKIAFYYSFSHILESELDVLRSVWLGLNNVAQLEVIQNSSIWLKYVRIRNYLKNEQYNEVAKLFNKLIVTAEIPPGFPALRYLDLEDDIVNTINIANRTDDVGLIHQFYPEIPINVIERAKQHYYIDNHLFFDGQNFKIGRFGRTSLENLQWTEAAQGFHFGEELDQFKWLLAHEYIEAKLMEKGLNFRSFINPINSKSYDMGAHWLSPLRDSVTGDIIYWNIGRNSNPPSLNINNLSNVDEIVNWYIDFYKL